MIVKLLEIRDRGTCISAMAIQLDPTNEEDRRLLAHAGFGRLPEDQRRYILFGNMDGGDFAVKTDRYDWGRGTTMEQAHVELYANWEKYRSGDLMDLEYLRGERPAPKPTDLGVY